MVTQDRWMAAQQYERGFWQAQAEQIADGSISQMEWYGWRSGELTKRLAAAGLAATTDGTADVIEVGCGPIGVASFFPARSRVAVDPLEDYYSTNPVLTSLRNPSVSYRCGAGESLPCDSNGYDLAIIENCIDHVQDVDSVMRELRRVLRPGGILYLTVNNRTALGYLTHRVISRLRLDPGHPHTFTPSRVRRLLERHEFDLLELESGSYRQALREDLTARQPRALAKALLGTSEFLVSVLARAPE
jgi:SAM-dependent methyltransferase